MAGGGSKPPGQTAPWLLLLALLVLLGLLALLRHHASFPNVSTAAAWGERIRVVAGAKASRHSVFTRRGRSGAIVASSCPQWTPLWIDFDTLHARRGGRFKHCFNYRFRRLFKRCKIFPVVVARDTPTRLMEAAQELLIAGGEAATSLRAIARLAHANSAAVHYHFGGRDELLRAVLDQYRIPLRERRWRDVDAVVERAGPRVPLNAIVEAALRADLELLSRLRRDKAPLARLLGQTTLQRGSAGVTQWCGSEFIARLVTLLRPALPDLRSRELAERVRLTYAGVCALFMTTPDPGEVALIETDSTQEQLRRLTAVTAGALAAPPARLPRRRPSDEGKGHSHREGKTAAKRGKKSASS
jgi:AcrR family transcriptional regulator